MTTLTIGGREAPLGHLWRPWMSLSSARTDRRAATYVLTVDRDTILSALSGPYDLRVAEMKEDDETTGTTDVVGEAGYPPLEVVLGQPELLSEVLGGYLLHEELFAAVLPPAPQDVSGTWAIDTVDEARLEGEQVVFQGTCYAF